MYTSTPVSVPLLLPLDSYGDSIGILSDFHWDSIGFLASYARFHSSAIPSTPALEPHRYSTGILTKFQWNSLGFLAPTHTIPL